jgi:hypothetical protein
VVFVCVTVYEYIAVEESDRSSGRTVAYAVRKRSFAAFRYNAVRLAKRLVRWGRASLFVCAILSLGTAKAGEKTR